MSILNPATFLDLVQRTHYECGIQGTPPTELDNAVGINLQLYYWVNDAWRYLQAYREDWHFMHRTFSFVTVAGQVQYTATQAGITEGRVSSWRLDTFRQYLTSADQASEIRMRWLPYDEFRDTQLIGALRTSQRVPMAFTIDKEMDIQIECPLVGYTITGEAYAAVTGFADDGDVPTNLDLEDRMYMVYKAMEYYANFNNAPDVLATAQKEQKRILNRLDIRRLDRLST